MMRIFMFFSVIYSVLGFFTGIPRYSRFTISLDAEITDSSEWPAWPGDRPPMPTLARYTQRMDASWGRGKFRKEVWQGKDNPVNFWWLNYAPSKEEVEALAQGYDFADPKAWFEAKGIDYEQAKIKTKELANERVAAYNKAKESEPQSVDESMYKKVAEDYFALQKKFYETSIRYDDNLNQAAKGQPSLDVEDDGTRWKNEPI